jgi:hypothetical protein
MIKKVAAPTWIAIVFAGIAAKFFARSSFRASNPQGTVYRIPFGFRLLVGIAVPVMVYGAGQVALSPNGREDW